MNFIFLILLTIFITMPTFAGHIYYVTPKVDVLRNGQVLTAKNGMQIYPQDRIKTNKDGFAILDFDGIVKVKVGKSTSILSFP